MSTKDWLKIIAFLIVFYATARYALGAIAWLFTKPEIVVSAETAFSGHITGVDENRQTFRYYIDNNQKSRYNFNHFISAQYSDTDKNLPQEDLNRLELGPYLQKGDYVSKKPHSTKLTVRRGSTETEWTCATSSASN